MFLNFLLFLTIISGGCGKRGQSDTGTTDPGKDTAAVTKTIVWDQQTLRRVSSSAGGERYCGYARMVQLSDGSLLCVYEADGSVVTVRSSDGGTTWSAPATVAARKPGINMAVPDILKLADGGLLVMYNPRPYQIDPSRRFGIAVRKSTDNGKTWGDEKIVYQAGHQFENGCWEPAAIQLPNGQIQLFFANEGLYTASEEQNISLLRSDDNGNTWTATPEIVSFRQGSRDGMPVPLLLKNSNKIIVAIEDNGFTNFKPYLLTNTTEENWKRTISATDKNRRYALSAPLSDAVYAGAPYIRQLSTGETILSYQGTEFRRSNAMNHADMKVVLSDHQAAGFGSRSIPFLIGSDKSALWNSLAVLDDDTIIALTSTNGYNGDGRTEVWMIKGRLKVSR